MLSKIVRTGFTRAATSGVLSRLSAESQIRTSAPSRSFFSLSSSASSSSSSSSLFSRLLLLAPFTAAVAYRQYSDTSSLLPKSGFAEELRDFVVKDAEKLNDGDMIEVKVGEKDQDKILVAKVDGKYYATGNFCTHFGAPLGNSLLIDNKIICPWHFAAFNVKDGNVEQSPALSGLPTYKTEVDANGTLHVKLPAILPSSDGVKSLGKRDPNNPETYVIIGGGPAGLSAAQTLRGAGFTGRIVVIASENTLPYDRTILSKWITGAEVPKLVLRSAQFLQSSDIEYKIGLTVVGMNAEKKHVILDNNTLVKYDKLLAATGGAVRVPPVKGVALNGVYTVRNSIDFGQTKAAIDIAKDVVVIGGSFIGMECAASLLKGKPDVNITIVDFFNTPYQQVLGSEIGAGVQVWSESKGIKFHMGDGVKEIRADDKGNVKSVLMDSGKEILCDTVLVGAGIHPQAAYLRNTGVEFMPDTSVKVDESFMATKDIYAAGDIATYPDLMRGGQLSRFEHWNMAIQTGAYAGLAMLGKKEPFKYVPFFWTRIWDKSISYVGQSTDWDDFYMLGEINAEKQDFIAFYMKGGKIEAASTLGRGRQLMVLAEAMRLGIPPTAADIKNPIFDFAELEKQVKEKARKEKGGCRRCCHRKKKTTA